MVFVLPEPRDDAMSVEDPQAGQDPIDTTEESYTCARCGTEFAGDDACPACGGLLVGMPCAAHPDRTGHSRCVICGRPVCDRCRAEDRVPALCPDHETVPVIANWAQVYSTSDEMEGGLVVENLRAEGVDAQVYSQNDHIFPVDMGELAIVRVLVPVWEYGQALEIIRSYMDSEGEVGFACPSCGEVYEPGQAQCSACGADLTA